ncbi:MAG: PilZ domain-containing protein [Magnetococcus sp. YQC-5]
MDNQASQEQPKNLESGHSAVHFINAMMLTINRSRYIPAVMESFNLKKIVLRSSADKLAVFMSMSGDKQIRAYVATEAGHILIVESISDATMTQGKGATSGDIYLSFNVSKIRDTDCGNVYDKSQTNRMLELFRNYIAYLKKIGNFFQIEAVLPFYDVSLGIQFILEHNNSFEELLTSANVYQPTKQKWGEENAIADGDESLDAVWVLGLDPTGQNRVTVQDPSVPTVKRSLADPAGQRSQPSKPASLNTPTADPLALEIADTILNQPSHTPVPNKRAEESFLASEEALRNHIRLQAEFKAEEIRHNASSMAWTESNIGKIMIGDGNFPATRASTSYAKANHRNNYRVYFYDFPAMIMKDGIPMYARIINISSTGAGIGLTLDPTHPIPPLNMGDEIQLILSLVNMTNLDIKGRVIRHSVTKDKDEKPYYYYGIHFYWPRLGAPESFVDSIRKTELFLMTQNADAPKRS